MKYPLSLLAALLFVAAPASAQGGAGRGGMGRGPQVEELKQALKLDSAQTAAVRALADTFRAETEPQRKEIERRMRLMRAAREGGASEDSLATIRSGMRASLADIQHHRAAFEDKVRLMLRPDQLAAFDTWKKAQLERRESMQRGRQS